MNKPATPPTRGLAGGLSGRKLLASSALLATPLAILAQTAPTTTETPSSAAAADDEVVVLSPFEVVGETRGYQATNTMSGTRFNTKLEDLASSITVMTKNQMSDFAMIDLNDVFLYVAGTEGSGTYTDVTIDRNGSVSDNVQLNPTQANRVRGLAAANVALDNIETMGRVPVDPITVDALEVSRGANANVFGLGNPSGTVNQVSASANLSRDKMTTEARADSYGGWRTSLDVNQVLLKDKLAIRGSAVFQQEEFTRKPSGVKTERYNGMIKYKPFKYTTIAGSVFYYHAYGNRPNTLPPRDNISYWLSQGSLTWDPVTQTVHNADGTVYGKYTAATYNGPDVFSAGYLGNDASQMFIDQSGLTYWAAPRGTTSTTSPNAATLQAARYLQLTAGPGMSGTAGRPANPLWSTTPTISDKSIYDWSEINLSAPNRFWDKTTTYNASIDQIIFDSTMQTLAAQVSFMREDSERWTRNLIGIANDNGQSGQLTIDINERLLDGSVNPYFLRPYLTVDRPRIAYQPATWDTARAQLAYRLDLTKEKSWIKWLGSHQLTGYGEYKHRVNRQYSWREGITSDVSWLASTDTNVLYRGFQSAPSANPSLATGSKYSPAIPYSANRLAQNLYRFYVGDKVTVDGINVDYAPGDFSYGTYNYTWGNAATGVFTTQALEIGQIAADKTGGTFNTDTTLKTAGAVIQSHFLEDRVITTFGVRQDKVRTKYGSLGDVAWTTTYSAPTSIAGTTYEGVLRGVYLNTDGKTFNYDVTDAWGNSFETTGTTTNTQLMLRPFYNMKFANDMKQSGSGFSRFLGDLLNGFSIYGNRSSSFLPISPSQDLYKNTLPNTTGKDKSWGMGFNLMDGKLYVRFTRYNNTQRNAQTTDLSTLAGRVLRLALQTLGAGSPTPYLNLHDTMAHAVQYVVANNLGSQYPTYVPQGSESVDDVVARLTGFAASDIDYYASANPPIAATIDTKSIGSELEINYNPTTYWTVSASVTDTKTVNENVSAALKQWIDERMPFWTSLVDPSISTANAIAEGNPNKLWWLHKYGTSSGTAAEWAATANAPYTSSAQTPQYNYTSFVQTPFTLMRNLEGQSNPQVRRYNFRLSTSYGLRGITDNKWVKNITVGGAVRWEDKGAIGYHLLTDTELDVSNPWYDDAHYYFDAFVSYKTKLWSDKVSATFKINAKNIGQHGSLRPVSAFPDGSICTYRIVDPQQFIFTATFDF